MHFKNKCSGCDKWSYPSIDVAISRILFELSRGAPPLRYYPCPHFPDRFHLTKAKHG